MKIFDISPLISESIAVWPGDTPFTLKKLLEINKGENIDLGTINTTLHLGAHVDAPSHYQANSRGVHEVDLSIYFGQAQVIEVSCRGERIKVEHLKESIQAPRILFKTGSYPDPHKFNTDFSSLSPELIEHLASKSVKLIGIDTPSVDPFNDKLLLAHQALFKFGVLNLEGLLLNNISPGLYNLIALPLNIKNADASPVRAILYKE